jgi:hypothetical protein
MRKDAHLPPDCHLFTTAYFLRRHRFFYALPAEVEKLSGTPNVAGGLFALIQQK